MSPVRHILLVDSGQGNHLKIESFLNNELSFQCRLTKVDSVEKALAYLQKQVFDLAVVEDAVTVEGHLQRFEQVAPDLPLVVLGDKEDRTRLSANAVFFKKEELTADRFIPEVLKVWNRVSRPEESE
jgi:hypothetical protein